MAQPSPWQVSRTAAFAGGLLWATAPLPFALAGGLVDEFGLPHHLDLSWRLVRFAAACLASLTLLFVAVTLLRGHRRPRWLMPWALMSAGIAAAPGVFLEPASALATFTGTAALLSLLSRARSETKVAPSETERVAARTSGALTMAALAWFTAAWHQSTSPWTQYGVLVAAVVAAGFAASWLRERSRRGAAHRPPTWRLVLGWGGAVVLLFAAAARLNAPLASAGLVVLAAAVPRFAISVPAPLTREDQSRWGATLAEHPARLLVVTFAALGAGGALLLALPASSTGAPISPLDAAFTSVSATCVTGLIVVDTPHAFTLFGQFAVMLLIQTGGLGIMTFSTAALALLGQRPSIRHEGAVSELVGADSRADVFVAVRRVLRFTFLTEAAGAALLTSAFLTHGDSLPTALWRGVFTAISAFCNAGFALQTDSLIPYQQDALVLQVVAWLIVLGGLGPLVVTALPRLVRRRPTTAYVRLALFTTVALLVVPTLLIAAFEWHHALAGLPLLDKLDNAFFQSATLRTAGFNSVDMAALGPATQVLMVALMFIGGCPGSTAGGIKTTTAAVLVLAVTVALRRRDEVRVFGRRIAHGSVYRAVAIATLFALFALLALIGLLLTQPLALNAALFEVASAMGTVGLSLGATAQVDGIGKILLMVCMFAGRVGPLTLFMLFSNRKPEPRQEFPAEEIAVG